MTNKRESDRKFAASAVENFIKRGGKISIIETGQRTEIADIKSQWGRPRKKTNIPPIVD
jgi:hypothetical protein